MYRARTRPKNKKLQRYIWMAIIAVLASIGWLAYNQYSKLSTPKTEFKQAKAIYTKVDYSKNTKKFSHDNFELELPNTWHVVNLPNGNYRIYSYKSNSGSDGQIIQIYEDSTPTNYAVNRALIVKGQGDKLSIESPISDNCSTYTKNGTPVGQYGAAARWQGIDFLCDMANTTRNVIGTSSTDGINTVNLTSPLTGQKHSYFFSDTANGINPDYSTFINALNSFRVK